MTKPSLNTILLLVVAVSVTWQIRGCVTKTPPNEELIIAKEQIKSTEKARIADSLIMVEKLNVKETELVAVRRVDSLLQLSFNRNQTVYKPIYDNLKNIGSRFDRIVNNDDSLRAAGKRRYD